MNKQITDTNYIGINHKVVATCPQTLLRLTTLLHTTDYSQSRIQTDSGRDPPQHGQAETFHSTVRQRLSTPRSCRDPPQQGQAGTRHRHSQPKTPHCHSQLKTLTVTAKQIFFTVTANNILFQTKTAITVQSRYMRLKQGKPTRVIGTCFCREKSWRRIATYRPASILQLSLLKWG